MNTDETIKFYQSLENEGYDEVRLKVANGNYGARKIKTVEEWLRHKEAGNDAPTYIYHEIESPEGVVFPAYMCALFYKKGWVDTPAKFGRKIPITRRISSIVNMLVNFWLDHWKFIITSIIAIAAIYFTTK